MNHHPDRLEELLQACLHGTLEPDQERELAQLLHDHPEARQKLRAYLQIEGGLLSLARARCLSGEQFSTDEIAARGCDLGGSGSLSARPPQASRRFSARRLAWGLAGLAASVALVLAAGYALLPRTSTFPAIAGHVVAVEGTLEIVLPSGETRPVRSGETLQAGVTLRTGAEDSFAVIEDSRNRRLELSPGTVVRLPAVGQSLELTQGVLRGQAAGEAANDPLVVATRVAEVRLQGDRFALSSVAPESVRVDVEAGKAEVVRQGDQKSVALESGASIFVQAEAMDMIVERARYVTEPHRVLGFPGAWAVTFPAAEQILAASYRELQRFGPGAEVQKVRISPGTSNGRLAAFTRDGNTLLVYRGLDRDDAFVLWDVATQTQKLRIDARVSERRYCTMAPDAGWLATVDTSESRFLLHLWDGQTGSRRVSVPTPEHIDCLASAPSGQLVAAGLVNLGRRSRNAIWLLDPATGEQRASLPTNAYPLTVMAFSPDGRYLAAGITGQVQLWDVEKRELIRTIRGFERVVQTLAFSPDGRLMAGGTQDGQVWLWDASRGEEIQVIQAGTSGVRLLAFTPDGRFVLTGVGKLPLMLWDVPKPQPRAL